MILVVGTKRSGTSAWMQILKGAGLTVIGEPFPSEWGTSIRDANPHGFYESRYRQGVFYATNPDPKTGAFLFPKDTRAHVVKVFVPGLVRTDYAYLDRVLGTIRGWRDYAISIGRLYALEDEHLEKQSAERLEKARAARPKIPAHVEWFLENYELIRDFSVRRFPFMIHSYERLIEDPERVVDATLKWIGGGDRTGALEALDKDLHRQKDHPTPDDVPPEHVAVYDDLFQALHDEKPLSEALVKRMDELQKELIEAFGALSRDRGREDAAPATPEAGSE